jgi:hypothetical protein
MARPDGGAEATIAEQFADFAVAELLASDRRAAE